MLLLCPVWKPSRQQAQYDVWLEMWMKDFHGIFVIKSAKGKAQSRAGSDYSLGSQSSRNRAQKKQPREPLLAECLIGKLGNLEMRTLWTFTWEPLLKRPPHVGIEMLSGKLKCNLYSWRLNDCVGENVLGSAQQVTRPPTCPAAGGCRGHLGHLTMPLLTRCLGKVEGEGVKSDVDRIDHRNRIQGWSCKWHQAINLVLIKGAKYAEWASCEK